MSDSARTRALAVLAAFALGGCGREPRSVATSDFAVGWEGKLRPPLLMTGCTPPDPGASPVLVASADAPRWFRAPAEGELTVRCGDDGEWRIRVRRPARFEIQAPATLAVGAREAALLRAFSADGESLQLGEAGVAWEVGGAIREAGRLPHDLIAAFVDTVTDAPSIAIEGAHLGTGTLSVSRHGAPLDVRATISVVPP